MIRINKVSTFMAYATVTTRRIRGYKPKNDRLVKLRWYNGRPLHSATVQLRRKSIKPVKEQEEIPFVAFGNGELDGNDTVGTYGICPECGEEHEVGYGEKVNPDGTREPSKLPPLL